MSRRGTIAITVAGTLLVCMPLPVQAATPRVVRHTYHSMALDLEAGAGGAGVSCFGPAAGPKNDCLEATARRHEHSVRIEMHDVSGLPVLGYLYEGGHAAKLFCGAAKVPVYPGEKISVEAPVGVSSVACSEPTTGTMVAVFSEGG